jgi:capsular exopolysaccharide synthesis family protein
MSKNFELMQDAKIRLDIPEVGDPKPSSASLNGKTKGRGKRVQLNLEDEVTREESSKLVQNIFLLRKEESPRVVAFAGIDSGNGCSWICAQVASILASQKLGSVCLVDANLRSPSLPELFGVTNHFGLTDALARNGSIREFAKVVRSDNLWLLSCGSLAAESSGLLNSETMKSRVSELRKEFDYVLIDSPPLNTYSDGLAVGQLADGLVLVLEANSTRREAATKVTENLRAAQIKILGAVLNKRTFPIPGFLYGRL